MFFAKSGIYEPCGMYNLKHLSFFIITIICVIIGVKCTKNNDKNNIRKIIRISTVVLWVLEILKLGFNFIVEDDQNLNRVLPLYYCSMLLYAGFLSSVGKGVFKKMGDSFIATGAIVGGLVFLIFPTTSLPEYPMFHFISFHSYVYHGIMVYLSLIINKSKYIDLKISDMKYYAVLSCVICILAYIVNVNFGTNLMFISRDFPGTPLEFIYKHTGSYFTIIMSLAQMTLPFLLVLGIIKLNEIIRKRVCS